MFLLKVPLEVLQNSVLIQLIVMPHILGKVQGQIKEVCRLIEPCPLIGTREYIYSMGKARFIKMLNVKTLGHLTKPVSFLINERLDLGTLFKITVSLKVHCETLDPLQ